MLVLDRPTEEVRRRWARAARLGLRADTASYPEGTTDSDLTDRRDRMAELFREERAVVEPLVGELAARSWVAIVADPEGIIVLSRGREALADVATRVRLVEGASWSESARGTNAIGTAIAERRSVAVVGAAHFEERNRGLFCYAKPIFDALGGLVGVLDVTGPLAHHDAAVGQAVEAAGLSLERALASVAFGEAGRCRLATIEGLVRRASGLSLLVDASGRVRETSAAARAVLGGAPGPAMTSEVVFGVPFAELELLAQGGRSGMLFETRRCSYRVELDPIPGVGARLIGVVVHLEPTRGRSLEGAPPRRRAAVHHPAFDAVVATDARLLDAKSHAARLARTELPVLLLAETGTGKELFARAVHAASPRAAGPFVALNCGALGSSLLESELFGYAPGAFTGALRAGSVGKLGAAHGGTLFLDEIAEMPEALQAALLRVLDDGIYHRVGDPKPSRADFRLVCATCRDLPELVARGRFRKDLFFRVQGGSLSLPPLRERTDRVHLARSLLRALAPTGPELEPDAEAFVEGHGWPGNVRELKSALVHALAMSDGAGIREEDFPRPLLRDEAADEPAGPTGTKRDEILRRAVHEAMRACEGNVARAARRLGVARSTVYRALAGDADR